MNPEEKVKKKSLRSRPIPPSIHLIDPPHPHPLRRTIHSPLPCMVLLLLLLLLAPWEAPRKEALRAAGAARFGCRFRDGTGSCRLLPLSARALAKEARPAGRGLGGRAPGEARYWIHFWGWL
jgi:hypothetical protein